MEKLLHTNFVSSNFSVSWTLWLLKKIHKSAKNFSVSYREKDFIVQGSGIWTNGHLEVTLTNSQSHRNNDLIYVIQRYTWQQWYQLSVQHFRLQAKTAKFHSQGQHCWTITWQRWLRINRESFFDLCTNSWNKTLIILDELISIYS